MKNRSVLLTGMLVFILVLVTACGTAGTPPYEATAAAVEAQNQADIIIADAEATASAIVAAAGNGEVVQEVTEEPADLVDVAANTEGFSTLVAAVQAAGLEETLRDGEFTVFAPTDDAFATALDALGLTAEELLADTETLTSILLYHVVEGTVTSDMLEAGDVMTVNGAPVTISLEDGVMVNDVTVVTADVEASNGVIHVIDGVLLPPVEEPEAVEEATTEPEAVQEVTEEPADLVDVAANTEGFSTLVAAVQAAGLEETLRDGEFTVFAPTDDAFATALDALGLTAEELLADTETLTSILLYHVVEGTVTSDMLEAGDVMTVNGAPVTISLEDGVMVNDVTVVTADVEASNGVIHVIDGVLLPPVEEPEMAEEVSSEESLLMTFVDFADAERGEELFAEMKAEVGFACSTCHLVDTETQLIGPGLLNVYDHAGDRVEGEGAYEYIYTSIRNSQAYIVDGYAAGLMPVYTEELLPDEDIYHIMAYLLTLGE